MHNPKEYMVGSISRVVRSAQWILSALFFLVSCSQNDKTNVTRGHLGDTGIDSPSPALNPNDLPSEQRALFLAMSAKDQRTFASLSPQQRIYFVSLLKPLSPHEAVQKAAIQSVMELPKADQRLYAELDEETKPLFLALDNAPTQEAVELSQSVDPNLAVRMATQHELESSPAYLQRIYHQLSPTMRPLFLALTETSQAQIPSLVKDGDYNLAVRAAAQLDIQRLQPSEQAFITKLSPEDQTIFLLMTPGNRSLAMLLVSGIDPKVALQYATTVWTEDQVNENT